eukprot:TRINITY_DN30732_c0_g1_i1.p1 TRINITY_DN30732_c0_g1~~TRINITY_DN30732_c0_g1_i1.p1  ORF type:complete len:316 (+),score=152.12 TRINITY_DN30732_c0_g1_i1:134-1081(+)
MSLDFDLDAEVVKELQLLQAQLEHSRAQRKKREDAAKREKEKELVQELKELKEVVKNTPPTEPLPAPPAPDVINDAASVISSTAPSTAATDKPANIQSGQVVVKKKKKPMLQAGSPLKDGADDGASDFSAATAATAATTTSLNPAELKRQREEEAKARKAAEEAEKQAMLTAQKSDPATEKGGWLEMWEKSWKGWGKSQHFAVARKEGFFLYKTEPQGRGSTAGGVKYDQGAKAADVIEYEKLIQNSRGSSKPHKSQFSRSVAKDEHAKSEGKQDFGINYFDGKAYQWRLFLCSSAQDRDQWCDFLSKFVKERKF